VGGVEVWWGFWCVLWLGFCVGGVWVGGGSGFFGVGWVFVGVGRGGGCCLVWGRGCFWGGGGGGEGCPWTRLNAKAHKIKLGKGAHISCSKGGLKGPPLDNNRQRTSVRGVCKPF